MTQRMAGSIGVRYFHASLRSFTKSKLHHHLHAPNLSFEQEYDIRSSLERLITQYSQKEIPQLTLKSLIELSRSTPKQNAISTINYLTIFNSKRLAAFRSLPYLVVLNPHISETYNLYLESLRLLLNSAKGIDDEHKINKTLLEFVDIHKDAIPALSRGFQEVSDLYPIESIVDFLNHHFSDKINMETMSSNYLQSIRPSEDHIGIVNTRLKISELINIYAGFVNDMTFIKYYKQVPVKVDFGSEIEFPYIGNHLEYIITEILKNSIRAHIESNKADIPVLVTIVETKHENSDKKILGIRFRDEGGGIPVEIEKNIFDYSFTSVNKNDDEVMAQNTMGGEDVNIVAGMGYGLPLTKAYVEQFGGSLELQSCYGLGTDVYVELNGPDDSLL